jgi:mannose-6-phosphate isomerase
MSLYPLKFRPKFVEKMWGGRKIETVLGKPLPAGKLIGESWELYDFPPGVVERSAGWVSSEIANGPLVGRSLHSIVTEFGHDLYGRAALSGKHGQFPILIKFLDAREDLSVQVHPDEKYCASHEGAHLKSEAWYVLQNDPGSRLLKGLRPGTTRDAFREAIRGGSVEALVTAEPVAPGQCHYLPSGTLHALGAGILVAEVQTPSDTTFRVFDFNRVDPTTGKTRSLHVEQALECMDFSGEPSAAQPRERVARSAAAAAERLVASEYFKLEKVTLAAGGDEPVRRGEPVVWIVLKGDAELRVDGMPEPTIASAGETILLPATMANPRVRSASGCAWLEVTFPAAGA